ncbi:MAG: hypothetical protein ABSF63_07110 [Candidatus Bathyarchaeia archaeon]
MLPKTYIPTTQNSQDLVLTSTKIALVTLVQSSIDNRSETNELIDEIRQYLQSSGLPKAWSIEKITILDDTSPTAKIWRTSRQDDLTVP